MRTHISQRGQRPDKIPKGTALIDVREKQGIRGGRRSALVPHPQMIAPDEALPARSDNVVPIVVSQLYGLVHPTTTVTQIRRLRGPKVGAETLYVTLVTVAAAGEGVPVSGVKGGEIGGGLWFRSQSEGVRVMHKAAVREDPPGAEPRNDNLVFLFSLRLFFRQREARGERGEGGREAYVERLSETTVGILV